MERKGLSANTLKMIAATAMLIDHIAWAFVPAELALGILMHTIGRLTMPIMCYFIAEGFRYTRNVKKYALRLGLFALISQIPYAYFSTGHLWPPGRLSVMHGLNVMFSLLLALLALWAWNSRLDKSLKTLLVGLCFLAAFPADWMYYSVLFVFAFELNRGDFKKQALWFSVVTATLIIPMVMTGGVSNLFVTGVLLSLPLLYLYNGKRGGFGFSKWIFYVFYPLHLFVIGVIKFGL